jgi:hypothetical protein
MSEAWALVFHTTFGPSKEVATSVRRSNWGGLMGFRVHIFEIELEGGRGLEKICMKLALGFEEVRG